MLGSSLVFFLMMRQPPISTRSNSCFPFTTRFRSHRYYLIGAVGVDDLLAHVGMLRHLGSAPRHVPAAVTWPGVVTVDGRAAAILHPFDQRRLDTRSEEHTSELQSLMRISYDVLCLKKQTIN